MSRPDPSEYAPYYSRYIDLVPGGDIVSLLRSQIETTLSALRSVPAADSGRGYAPDKWTLLQMVSHMNDTERIMAYRALRIARGDPTPLAGFEQEDFVARTDFSTRTWAGVVDELEAVRAASVLLFGPLTEAEWTRRGTASENVVSVRALAFIIAGHELHHRRLLESEYKRVVG